MKISYKFTSRHNISIQLNDFSIANETSTFLACICIHANSILPSKTQWKVFAHKMFNVGSEYFESPHTYCVREYLWRTSLTQSGKNGVKNPWLPTPGIENRCRLQALEIWGEDSYCKIRSVTTNRRDHR